MRSAGQSGRAILGAALAAALTLAPAGTAGADTDLTRRAAERDATQALVGASRSQRRPKLPLAARLNPRNVPTIQARVRQDEGSARLLVGVRRHADVPAVREVLEAEGADVRELGSIGVLVFTADSAAGAAARLSADPRVAFVERSRRHRVAGDPATDTIDPETGIPFDWAFERVRAPQALAAVGGGSDRTVAVLDTGVDVGHPDLATNIVGRYNARTGTTRVGDTVGHGTFVAGTIAMVHDNEIGGRGVAGRTPILALKADNPDGYFDTEDLVAAIEFTVASGARVLNMSLGGEGLTRSETRALDLAFLEDVLPVAAAGNSGEEGSPTHYPAATVGGEQGVSGIGLAVGATGPDDKPSPFSTRGPYVSVAAPGGGATNTCRHGVYSTIPRSLSGYDDPRDECLRVFTDPAGGSGAWTYSEGTSFAAPIASGIAALAWQAEPRLQSQQVAEVLMRSARQTVGAPGTWNEATGTGIVDGEAAVKLARVFDVLEPAGMTARQTRKSRNRMLVIAGGGVDRTDEGDELAGDVTHFILRSIDGRDADVVATGDANRVARTFSLTKGRRYRFIGAACDGNGNCAIRRLSTVKAR